MRINTAQRLRRTLYALKHAPATENVNGTIRQLSGFHVLSTNMAIGLEAGYPSVEPSWRVLKSLSILTQMFDDFYAEVQGTNLNEEEKNFYLRHIPGLIDVLSPLTQAQPWAQLSPRLSEVGLESLDAADMRLRVLINEEELEDVAFAELLKEISETLQLIGTADIDPELRDFVVSQLLKVKQAIDEYRFRGVKGFREALAGYVGAVTVFKNQSEASCEVENSTSGTTLLDRLQKIGTVASTILTLTKSTPWVWKHLLLPVGEHVTNLIGK